ARKEQLRAEESPTQRQRRLHRDAESKAFHRSRETKIARSIRQTKDAIYSSTLRSNESQEQRASRLAKDAQSTAESRANETPDQRASRLSKDAAATAQSRAKLRLDFNDSIQTFADKICYPKQVQTVMLSNLPENILADELLTNNDVIVSCHRCATTLRRGRTPTQAYWNGVPLDEIPPEIKILSDVEIRLLNRIIPFVKMWSIWICHDHVTINFNDDNYDINEICHVHHNDIALEENANETNNDCFQDIGDVYYEVHFIKAIVNFEIFNHSCLLQIHDETPSICGHLNINIDGFPNLKNGLMDFFTESCDHGAIITCNGISVAIWKHDNLYYLFDSHSRRPKGRVAQNGAACLISFTDITALWTVLKSNIPKSQGNRVDSDQYSITKITPDVHSLIQNVNEPENDTMAIRNTHHTTQSPNDLNNDNIVITSSVLRVIDVPIPELSTVIANDNCSQLPVHQLRRKTESPLQITRERRAEELSWFHLFPCGRNGLQENRPHPITPLDSVKPG
ncbi:hypothetical protein SFRURICE_019712, partial [Spodoptera frugiperda]